MESKFPHLFITHLKNSVLNGGVEIIVVLVFYMV